MSSAETQVLLGRLTAALCSGADEITRLEAYAKYWNDEGERLLRLQDKVAAEAILLAYLASRVPLDDSRLQDAVQVLCDHAEAHIVTSRNAAVLRRFPQTAATLGVGFVLLSQLGRSQPSIERLLRRAVTRGFATLSERSTFRLMDTRWTYGLLDVGLVRPVEELLPLSTLGASPHPIYTMNEDNYALTHAIYYLTDFGRRPPLALPQASDQFLDPFLAWNAIRADLDLLGEFLIAALALRQPRSPAFRFAWHLFFKAWDDNRGLVGPEFSSVRFAELCGEEASAYAFSENYHTAFVGGILCAVALTVPWPNSRTQGGGYTLPAHTTLASHCADAAARARNAVDGAPGYEPSLPHAGDLPEWAASRLLMVLGTSPDAAPLWLRAATDCALSREELASVLYDALLVEAARSYSLVQLSEALAVGASHVALRSPTFTRALEFLLDQELDNGFIGVNRLLAEEPDTTAATQAQAAIAGLLANIARALNY